MQTEMPRYWAQSRPLAPISRKQFEKMVEIGIWGPQDKVELLNGMMVQMSPQGKLHAFVVSRLDRLLQRLCGNDAEVGTQLPFSTSEFDLPEPDLVIIPGRRSRDSHPSRALLVVEVADSSLQEDRTTKAALYSAANVPEYWVVDVKNQLVEVMSQPLGDHYGDCHVARRGQQIDLLGLPGQSVQVEDIFAD